MQSDQKRIIPSTARYISRFIAEQTSRVKNPSISRSIHANIAICIDLVLQSRLAMNSRKLVAPWLRNARLARKLYSGRIATATHGGYLTSLFGTLIPRFNLNIGFIKKYLLFRSHA